MGAVINIQNAFAIRRETVTPEIFYRYKDFLLQCLQLNESREPEEIFRRLIKVADSVFPFEAVALLWRQSFDEGFYLKYEHQLTNVLDRQLRWVERSGYVNWVARSKQITVVPPETDEKLRQAVALMPLNSGKTLYGVVVFFLRGNGAEITTFQTDLLTFLAGQAAIAFENATLYQNMALQNQAIRSMKSFLENSLESMADGLFAMDLENRITLFNSAAEKLLGPSRAVAIGGRAQNVFAKDFVRFLDHAVEMTLTVGQFEEETDYQHPFDGRTFPLSLRMTPLRDESGKEIGVIAVCRDVSERRELIHLRQLEQMKEEFISSVSHELRTPLTAIKSFTEILLQYGKEDEASQKEFLTIIARETDRLIDLINDLLDVSKLSNPEFKLDLETVDMAQVVAESLRGLAVLAEEKNIQMIQQLDLENRFVLGDKKRLVQVMVNLVGNAIKFSPKSGKIEIRTEKMAGKRRRDSGDFLRVSVKDEGIGIPKEAQRKIFEKFTQITSRTEAKPHGTGLGLHICKQIVEKLGGNIWVESEVGKGSTFFFTVPLAKAKGEQSDEKLGTK